LVSGQQEVRDATPVSRRHAGRARVELSGNVSIGGACDVPRIEAQLERTVLQFDDVATVEILVNGVPLEDVLSNQ
jgi:hypothetical protein